MADDASAAAPAATAAEHGGQGAAAEHATSHVSDACVDAVSDFPAPLRSMELPQWVGEGVVDREAMPSAFLAYKATCLGEARTQLEGLFCI